MALCPLPVIPDVPSVPKYALVSYSHSPYRSSMSEQATSSQPLTLLPLDDGLHLANASGRGVRRLVYSTWACYPDLLRDGEVVVSARPYYELADLPPQSHVFLEAHDPYEDGIVFFQLESVVWDDGTEEGPALLRKARGAVAAALGRGSRLSPTAPHRALTCVEREKRKLHTKPAGTLKSEEGGTAGDPDA